MAAGTMTQPAVHRVTSMPAGVTAGAVSPSTGSIRLAGEHFAAAMIYLLAGAVGLVWIAPELAAGNYLSPHVAGVTHLFTLGWLTMTIFGALYQLLPVALGAPIRWRTMGHVSFWAFAPGAGLFACGVAESSTMLHHAGVGLVAVGVHNVAGIMHKYPGMASARFTAAASSVPPSSSLSSASTRYPRCAPCRPRS